MFCSLKAFGKAKSYSTIKHFDNAVRRSYRNKPERSNLIKVAVVGSGSLGDPAALIVKTCDNFMYV